jgi:hypothetical protein
MALDQVRVVAVHHPHELGETGGGFRLKARAKRMRLPGERGHEGDDRGAGLVQQARFYPRRSFFKGSHADL